MYVYQQAAHLLTRGVLLVTSNCHAGNGAGLNNAGMQRVHNVGPLPRGLYLIGRFQTHPHLGPLSAPLIPLKDAGGGFAWLFGRGGFYIHGPEFSEGCVVVPEPIRLAMSLSGDTELQVIA